MREFNAMYCGINIMGTLGACEMEADGGEGASGSRQLQL